MKTECNIGQYSTIYFHGFSKITLTRINYLFIFYITYLSSHSRHKALLRFFYVATDDCINSYQHLLKKVNLRILKANNDSRKKSVRTDNPLAQKGAKLLVQVYVVVHFYPWFKFYFPLF